MPLLHLGTPSASRRGSVAALSLALLLVLQAVCRASEPSEQERTRIAAAWEKATQLDFVAAHEMFSHLRKESDTLHVRYGYAISLLHLPPTTDARLNEVERLLAEIAAAGTGDLSIQARYFLCRIPDVHRLRPDFETAFAMYSALAKDHPAHFLGQLAYAKAALIDICWRASDDQMSSTLDHWWDHSTRMVHPVVRRNFCWQMGDAFHLLGGSYEKALEAYAEAEKLGFSRTDIDGLMLVRRSIFELRTNRHAQAAESIRRYIRTFPRRGDVEHMQRLLASLEEGVQP